MISNLFFRSVLIAFALILISGFARAEVAQCNDKDGKVLFTDKPCASSETVEPALFPDRGSIATASTMKRAARFGGDPSMAKSELANRRASPDTTTVLAARVSTDTSYQPWSMLRREQLAELALLAHE